MVHQNDFMNSTQDGTSAEPDSSFGYGLVYNPMDPYNMYPHHETGEEVYGPPSSIRHQQTRPFQHEAV